MGKSENFHTSGLEPRDSTCLILSSDARIIENLYFWWFRRRSSFCVAGIRISVNLPRADGVEPDCKAALTLRCMGMTSANPGY